MKKQNCHYKLIPRIAILLGCSLFSITMMAQQFNPNAYYRLIAKHNGQVHEVQDAGMENQADVVDFCYGEFSLVSIEYNCKDFK